MALRQSETIGRYLETSGDKDQAADRLVTLLVRLGVRSEIRGYVRNLVGGSAPTKCCVTITGVIHSRRE